MPGAPALPHAERGFTLLEVLVALVIIGVALAASMRGALSLTDTAEDTRLRLIAGLVAENRLREARLAREQVTVGETRFECGDAGARFACEQIVRPTPNPFFRRVEIRVLAPQGEASRQYAELVTLLPVDRAP